ncbi:UNVERIFIED_CONTAM: hypothetical protein K2H54_076289 [Gekko kuhli]
MRLGIEEDEEEDKEMMKTKETMETKETMKTKGTMRMMMKMKETMKTMKKKSFTSPAVNQKPRLALLLF